MYIFAKGGSSLFRGDNVQTIKYSDFVADVSGTGDNQISHGNFVKDNFEGTFDKGGGSFTVNVPPEESLERSALYQKMNAAHIKYDLQRPFFSDSTLGMFVSFLLPLGVIFFFWMFFLRQAQSGGNQAHVLRPRPRQAPDRQRPQSHV